MFTTTFLKSFGSNEDIYVKFCFLSIEISFSIPDVYDNWLLI
jgi:hypothetical protein